MFVIFWPVGFHSDLVSLGLPAEDSAFSVWPLIVAIALGIIALAVLYKFATTMDRTSGLVPFEDIQQADSSLTKEVLFYEYFFFKSLSRNFPCFTRKQATKTLRLAVTMSLSQNHLNILWRSRFLSHHFPGSWLCHRHLPGHPRVWHRASWMDWTYGHVAFGVSFHDLQCRFVKAGAKHGSIRKKKQTTNNKQHLEKQDLHSKHMFLFIIHESTKTASALIPQSCFFSFNWRPGCWMNGRNPLINYAGSLACYPFGALAVLCLLGVSKYFKVVWGGDLG